MTSLSVGTGVGAIDGGVGGPGRDTLSRVVIDSLADTCDSTVWEVGGVLSIHKADSLCSNDSEGEILHCELSERIKESQILKTVQRLDVRRV